LQPKSSKDPKEGEGSSWANKQMNSVQYAMICALGRDPDTEISRGKARSIIRNKLAKRRSKLKKNAEER
jgi:hypothetical protein